MSERVVVTPCTGISHSERWTTKDGRFVCRYCGADKGPVRAAETEPLDTSSKDPITNDGHRSSCSYWLEPCSCDFDDRARATGKSPTIAPITDQFRLIITPVADQPDLRIRMRDDARSPSHTEDSPNDLRAVGWSVAVHNDYRLNGVAHTFWLMTRGEIALKGEGRTDAEALNQIRARARALGAFSA